MFNSPISSYSMVRNPITGQIAVMYDDKNVYDEEMIYTFNPDGSATASSCAWGGKTECPKGAFSDILIKLPTADKYNSKIAKNLAVAYRNYERKNNLKATFKRK